MHENRHLQEAPLSCSGPASPAGVVDCHMHIYDSRIPFCEGASLPHPDATIDEYRAVQRRLGLSRAVVVAPSAYGTNNRATLDAIAALGPDARGVAIVDCDVSDRQLDAFHAAGIRGIRFNFNLSPRPTMEAMVRLAPRMAERQWHVQVGMRGPRLAEEAAILRSLPGTLVLEHCAGIPASVDVQSDPAYPIVMDLLAGGRAWIKLSGPYLREPAGAPAFPLLGAFVRHLVKHAPHRLVWGSDWPHPTERTKPDDAALFDLMRLWAPDAADRTRILVDNPARLYDFPAPAMHGMRSTAC